MPAASFDMAFLEALPNRLFGTDKEHHANCGAALLCIDGGDAGKVAALAEDLLESMADLLKWFSQRSGYLGGVGGCAAGGEHGHCRRHRGDHGVDVAADHAEARLFLRLRRPELSAPRAPLGQIIPPSIALVLLGDILSSAYQQAQLNMGIFTPKVVSIGDLFVGAIIPGLDLVVLYCLYVILFVSPAVQPSTTCAHSRSAGPCRERCCNCLPPIF